MGKFKLVYFKGCPNQVPAKLLLKDIGIEFESICQDDLVSSDPLKAYSSPTLLNGDHIIFGSKSTGGACSMPLPSREVIISLIKASK